MEIDTGLTFTMVQITGGKDKVNSRSSLCQHFRRGTAKGFLYSNLYLSQHECDPDFHRHTAKALQTKTDLGFDRMKHVLHLYSASARGVQAHCLMIAK